MPCHLQTVRILANCSLRTEICQFFVRARKELGVVGVMCSPQVRGKLIYHALTAKCLLTIWFAYVYQPLRCRKHYTNGCEEKCGQWDR